MRAAIDFIVWSCVVALNLAIAIYLIPLIWKALLMIVDDISIARKEKKRMSQLSMREWLESQPGGFPMPNRIPPPCPPSRNKMADILKEREKHWYQMDDRSLLPHIDVDIPVPNKGNKATRYATFEEYQRVRLKDVKRASKERAEYAKNWWRD